MEADDHTGAARHSQMNKPIIFALGALTGAMLFHGATVMRTPDERAELRKEYMLSCIRQMKHLSVCEQMVEYAFPSPELIAARAEMARREMESAAVTKRICEQTMTADEFFGIKPPRKCN